MLYGVMVMVVTGVWSGAGEKGVRRTAEVWGRVEGGGEIMIYAIRRGVE